MEAILWWSFPNLVGFSLTMNLKEGEVSTTPALAAACCFPEPGLINFRELPELRPVTFSKYHFWVLVIPDFLGQITSGVFLRVSPGFFLGCVPGVEGM